MAKLSAHGTEIFTASITKKVDNFIVITHLRLMSDNHILRKEDYKHPDNNFHDFSDGWKKYKKMKAGIDNIRLEDYYIKLGYEVERPQ